MLRFFVFLQKNNTMRKLITILAFSCIALMCSAQSLIFSEISYYDKFDDILKKETRKTLITKNDSTFVIEEKGKEPVKYYILNVVEEGCLGSKDSIVNLVGNNVFGFQKTWCLVRYDMLVKYWESYINYVYDSSDENRIAVSRFWIFATHRTITTQYTGTYQNEYFWLMDVLNDDKLGIDVERIVYSKDYY